MMLRTRSSNHHHHDHHHDQYQHTRIRSSNNNNNNKNNSAPPAVSGTTAATSNNNNSSASSAIIPWLIFCSCILLWHSLLSQEDVLSSSSSSSSRTTQQSAITTDEILMMLTSPSTMSRTRPSTSTSTSTSLSDSRSSSSSSSTIIPEREASTTRSSNSNNNNTTTTTTVNNNDNSENKIKKKMNLIIHIGPPKTATTSIQTDLYTFREDLERDGYYVAGRFYNPYLNPTTGKLIQNRISTPLLDSIKLLFKNSKTCNKGKKGENKPATISCIIDTEFYTLLQEYQYKKHIIISDEGLSKIWNERNNSYQALHDALSEQWNIRIITAYRHFYDWVQSFRFQLDRLDRSNIPKSLWPGEPDIGYTIHDKQHVGRALTPLFPHEARGWMTLSHTFSSNTIQAVNGVLPVDVFDIEDRTSSDDDDHDEDDHEDEDSSTNYDDDATVTTSTTSKMMTGTRSNPNDNNDNDDVSDTTTTTSIRTKFFCTVIPDAKHACEHSRILDRPISNRTETIMNTRDDVLHSFYDMITTDATIATTTTSTPRSSSIGIVDKTKYSRKEIRESLRQYHEDTLKLTYMDFPLLCPNKTELEFFLQGSLHRQRIAFFYNTTTTSTTSSSSSSSLLSLMDEMERNTRKHFYKKVKKNVFCTVDTVAVLNNDTYRTFFQQYALAASAPAASPVATATAPR